MDGMPSPILLTIAVEDMPPMPEVPYTAALTGRAYRL